MTDFLHLNETQQLFQRQSSATSTIVGQFNDQSRVFLSMPPQSVMPRQASIDALFASMNNNTLYRLSSLASMSDGQTLPLLTHFDEDLFNELNFPKQREASFALLPDLVRNISVNAGGNGGGQRVNSSHDSVYSTSDDSEISLSSTPGPQSPLSSSSTASSMQSQYDQDIKLLQGYQQTIASINNSNATNNVPQFHLLPIFDPATLPSFDGRQMSLTQGSPLPPLPNVNNVRYSFNYNYNDSDALSVEFDDSEFEFSPVNSVTRSVPTATRRLTNTNNSANNKTQKLHKRASSAELQNAGNNANNNDYVQSSRATHRQYHSERMHHRQLSSSSISAPNSPFDLTGRRSDTVSPKTLLLGLNSQPQRKPLSPSLPQSLRPIVPFNTGHPSSSLDLDPNEIVVGIYTRAERAAKIARYREKRARRQWTKKIMYNCRKSFADNRPRVGGRFIKMKNTESESGGKCGDGGSSENGSTGGLQRS